MNYGRIIYLKIITILLITSFGVVTPVYSQQTIATFGFGSEFLGMDDPINNDYSNGILFGINLLFIRQSGFTVSIGNNFIFQNNEKMNIDPIFGLGYVHYNKYYIGGIANLILKPYINDIFITPTFVGGYDFGQFSLGGQLSYMYGIVQSKHGFRFSLGAGMSMSNLNRNKETKSIQIDEETSSTEEFHLDIISGLYLETSIPPFIKQINNNAKWYFSGGATYMDIGLGVSLLNDFLRIQTQYGFMTQENYESLGGIGTIRYGGQVLGFKILGNYTLQFNKINRFNLNWLSASFSFGINFSLFDIGKQGYTQSGKPEWMTAVVMQIEFPRITIPEHKYFKTFSMFMEGQSWYVPTDSDASKNNISWTIPCIIFGIRTYIF